MRVETRERRKSEVIGLRRLAQSYHCNEGNGNQAELILSTQFQPGSHRCSAPHLALRWLGHVQQKRGRWKLLALFLDHSLVCEREAELIQAITQHPLILAIQDFVITQVEHTAVPA